MLLVLAFKVVLKVGENIFAIIQILFFVQKVQRMAVEAFLDVRQKHALVASALLVNEFGERSFVLSENGHAQLAELSEVQFSKNIRHMGRIKDLDGGIGIVAQGLEALIEFLDELYIVVTAPILVNRHVRDNHVEFLGLLVVVQVFLVVRVGGRVEFDLVHAPERSPFLFLSASDKSSKKRRFGTRCLESLPQ